MTVLLTSCSSTPKKLSCREKLEKAQLEYINKQIETNEKLSREQKDYEKKYTKCYLDLITNPYTVNNLPRWQYHIIRITVQKVCKQMLLGKDYEATK